MEGKNRVANIRIFSNNCRGYNSKKESVEKHVIEQLRPDVINLQETMLRNKSNIKQKEYFSFCMNRPEGAGGGGIATLVADSIKQHCTKIAAGNDNEEFMIVRLEHVKPALNIVNIYGRVESRTGGEKVLEGWTEIVKEVKKIEDRGEASLIIGDFNRAVGDGENGVAGNRPEVSYGGRLIRELVSSGDFFLLNNHSITTGGPWTRICPGTGKGSCLDLAIGSSNLLPYVRRIMIDSNRTFAPRRAVIRKGSLATTFTDHHPILVELEMPRVEESKEKPKSTWNTRKPGGWEIYKELTNKMARQIEVIADNESLEDDEVMEKIDKLQTKIKFQAFGKTKQQTERAQKREEAECKKAESDVAKELLARQTKRIEEQVKDVMEKANGRVTRVFKMKEIISGKSKGAQEAQATINPETNELVVSNSEIKKVTLKYCLKTLENNKPEEKVKEVVELKEEVHRLRMLDRSRDGDNEVTEEDFFKVLWKFESKRSATYEFIIKAGLEFKLSILKLCKRFIRRETFPKRFNLTTLIQLPK